MSHLVVQIVEVRQGQTTFSFENVSPRESPSGASAASSASPRPRP